MAVVEFARISAVTEAPSRLSSSFFRRVVDVQLETTIPNYYLANLNWSVMIT